MYGVAQSVSFNYNSDKTCYHESESNFEMHMFETANTELNR